MVHKVLCPILLLWLVFIGCQRQAEAPDVVAPPKPQGPPPPPQPAPEQVKERKAALASGVTLTEGFVVIPAGSFAMGAPDGEVEGFNDALQHPVTLTRAFEVQTTEVTEGQYRDLMGATDAQKTGCDDCPVVNVSWFQAVTYCNQLSKRRGLSPCYTVAGFDVQWKGLSCQGYRLPTEAEWEYAARAGTTGPRYGEVAEIAWIDVNSELRPQKVGQKRPNPWGLYDMLGNAFEWTWDWMGPYPSGPQTDPVGPPGGENRVFRGGSFKHPDVEARAAFRNGYGPGNQVEFIGFRCVRSLGRGR